MSRALGISFIMRADVAAVAAVAEPARDRQDLDRKSVGAECVTQCGVFAGTAGKNEPAPLRDRLDLIVA
jgi:hypothetical protein